MIDHGFRHTRLHNVIVTQGNMDRQQPHPTAQAGTGSQNGSSCHTELPGNKQRMTVIPFVGEPSAWTQAGSHFILFKNMERSLCFFQETGQQTDVKHLHIPQQFLVLREEERKLDLPDSQRQIRTDNERALVVCIVLAHQS